MRKFWQRIFPNSEKVMAKPHKAEEEKELFRKFFREQLRQLQDKGLPISLVSL